MRKSNLTVCYYRPAIIGVWARQRGGAGAAFDDDGSVRGETTQHKAKAWVVKGGNGSPAAVALDCRARDTGHGPVGPWEVAFYLALLMRASGVNGELDKL